MCACRGVTDVNFGNDAHRLRVAIFQRGGKLRAFSFWTTLMVQPPISLENSSLPAICHRQTLTPRALKPALLIVR
jgi:hypothetical protein